MFFTWRQAFKVLGFAIFLFLNHQATFAWAGQCRVTITILDEDQMELIGAYVEIPKIDQKAVSDISGEVAFLLEQGKSYSVSVRYLGFGEQQFTLDIPLENSFAKTISLKETAIRLQEVVVFGKSQEATVRDLPFKPQVINLSSIRAQPAPVTAVLNQLPGVRIRQGGGTGSEANIMLNGIDGKGVKIFIDGIPVYLLGAGYSINTLSPNMIERIEVYKGAIPVEFGSDALGGVINVVTRYGNADYADLSYSYGSWNTHKASVNASKKFGKDGKYFVNIDGFYDYADNNYWMDDVVVLIPGDPNKNTQTGRARRFNDQFESALARLQTGIRNVSWADELMLMASYSHIDREWQHGLWAEQAWGEPTSTQDSRNASVSWEKYSKNNRWGATITAGYAYDKLHFVDTALKAYFWDQNFDTTSTSETGNYANGTSPVLTTRSWFSRESVSYALTSRHTLNLTALFTNDELTIRNEVLGQDDQEKLLPPQELLKNYTGLALASKLLGGKLTNTVSAKHFYMQSSGVSMLYNGILGPREENEFSVFGYGDVIQYRFSPQLTINLGYEFTVRQPDNEEIFGNYLTIMPNPSLKPETSHNINLGAEFSTAKNRFNAGATLFYRNTSDRMFLNAVTSSLAMYENLLGTRVLGAEFHADYLILKGLKVSFNATYQDITLQETNPKANVPDRYLGARIPNTPYFFGNGQLSYSKKMKRLGNGRITAVYDFNYIHEFFLSWDEGASNQATIPTQALHNVNVSWMAPKDRWSIGVECRNLTDAKAYDNYSVQRPGRSFFVKTRFFLGT